MSMRLRQGLSRQFWRLVEHGVSWRDARDKRSVGFPTCQGTNFLYEPLFQSSDGEAYYTKFHQPDRGTNPYAPTFSRFKSDILKGRQYPKNLPIKVRVDAPSALPYSVTDVNRSFPEGNYAVSLKAGGEEQLLSGLVADRYYYLPILEPGDVELRSANDLIVGRPIALRQKKRHAARMVLVLYIDNFSWEIAKRLNFEQEMPNVARFFSKGVIFENCHAASNWTLPGAATLVSGKSLSDHLVFHNSRRDVMIGDGYPLLPEAFQADDYLTLQVGGAVRMSPAYGYVKGYDRTVYRWEMPIYDTLDVFYDHVRAFPDRDHFVWLSIMDAHHTLGHTPDLSVQMSLPLVAHDYKKKRAKRPWALEYDEGQTLRYMEALKRIDRYLGDVFSFVEERYSPDETVVCLMSDHGIGFSTNDSRPFSLEQTHVPFMLRGPNLPSGLRAKEMMQNTDVMPSILKAAGLPMPGNSAGKIEGRLPSCLGGPLERTYALSENRYAGQVYLATIKDHQFQFYLQSEGRVDDDGDFDLGDYTIELFDNKDCITDVAAKYPDLVNDYTLVVRDHVGK